jgi:hypothetical protein
MSKPETLSAPASEVNLGLVLAAIHRVLPRLDEPSRAAEVQATLERASAWLEAARLAHEEESSGAGDLSGEIVAAISAAIAVTLGRPYTVLDIKPTATPAASWTNAWAMEGRFAHYSSHKVR